MQPVKVISVNVGQPQDITLGKHHSVSGIDKRAVPERVRVGGLGLEGDHIMSRKHHGGPDQAVYLYSLDDYAAFAAVLTEAGRGQVPAPSSFGENLTVQGLESAAVRIGTRLEIGDVLLEVTAPRIPCATFAAHMGDAGFVKVFRQMRRPGLYARVLKTGLVGAGDTLTVLTGPEDAPTVGEQFELYYDPSPSREELERSLAAPIAIRSRQDYLERLNKLR
jgi:MOSC domain-containing protein YiiM